MNPADDDMLDPPEVAVRLRVPTSTVYKLLKAGQLPGRKIGKHWRTTVGELRAWIAEKNLRS